MILRSVIEHAKAQNWTAIALDFVIVVFGVFIGIQVSNWNEARVDRQLGRDYTKRLVSDLQQDFANARIVDRYYDQVLESVQEADRLLSASDPDPKALVVSAYRASEYIYIPPSRATWEEIVSSGQIGLLPEAATKSELQGYYKFLDVNGSFYAELLDSPYRLAVRSLIPLPVQLSIRDGCSDALDDSNIIIGFVTECRLDIDKSMLEETAETLRSSAAVRNSLRHQYSMVAATQVNNTGSIVLLERILGALSVEELE